MQKKSTMNQNCSHLYVGDVISGVSDERMPVFWRLHNVFPICHEPQQARPACRDGDASSQPVETKQKKKKKSAKTNSRQTQPTCRRNGPACTFERRHLARLRFRQAFLAGVGGQSQRDAAAAQQEANLLTSCVLVRQRGREALLTLEEFGG